MAEFTRFSETILTKQDQRVVSITVKPMISDCTGRIYFTDLMVQEGDRLTGYVINTETILQKYREDGSIVPPRFYNGVWSDTLKPHTQGDIIKHRKGVADGTEIRRGI